MIKSFTHNTHTFHFFLFLKFFFWFQSYEVWLINVEIFNFISLQHEDCPKIHHELLK